MGSSRCLRSTRMASWIILGRPRSIRASSAARIVRPVKSTSSMRITVLFLIENGMSVPRITGAPRMSRSSRYSVMSRVPTGKVVPSMAAILAVSRWARVTPRVRRPTKVRSLAPPLRSRISWAIRVRARSRGVSSSTCAFSRRRGGRVLTVSPYEPLWAHLKERNDVTECTLPGRMRVCQRVVASGEQRHELIDVHRLGDVGVEASVECLANILGLAVAGQRDQTHAGQRGGGSQAARHLHAVDVGQSDVAQDDLGPQTPGRPHPPSAAWARLHPG